MWLRLVPFAAQALLVKADVAAANQFDGVAELNYTQALAQVNSDSPETALVMESYARFLSDRDRVAEAKTLWARATAIRQNRVAAIASQVRVRTEAPADASIGPQTAQFISNAILSRYQTAYRVGGGVSAPVLVYKKEPEYTEEARAAKYSGAVVLRISISPEGKAYDFQLVKSLGFGLDEKAVEAVSQWKFTPGKKDGIPVAVEATIEVNFRLL